MMDVAALPAVTGRLLAAGYTEADLRKIWSGNLLRLLDRAKQADQVTYLSQSARLGFREGD